MLVYEICVQLTYRINMLKRENISTLLNSKGHQPDMKG